MKYSFFGAEKNKLRGFALIFEETFFSGYLCPLTYNYRPGLDVVLAVCNQRPRPGGAGMQTAIAGDTSAEADEPESSTWVRTFVRT